MEDYLMEGLIGHIHELSGFNHLKLVELEPGHAVATIDAHDGLSNCYHKLHGGSFMTIMDMVASAAGYTYGKHVITLQSSTNFIRGVDIDGSELRVVSDVVYNGRKTMLVETKIFDAKGRECARTESSMYIPSEVDPEAEPPRAPGWYNCNFLEKDPEW